MASKFHVYNLFQQKHIQDSKKAGQILWDFFHPIGNIAIEQNQDFMVEHNIPSWNDGSFPGEDSNHSKEFFSSNLTFTSNGFYNHPHLDNRDEPELSYAFLLCIPTRKSTGELALKSDGYNVEDGQFVFPDCNFGIDFKPNRICQMIF